MISFRHDCPREVISRGHLFDRCVMKWPESILLVWILISVSSSAVGGVRPDHNSQKRIGRDLNVCGLLTSSNIQAAQGEQLKDTKATVQPSGRTVLLQCLFRTTTESKSISLAVSVPSQDSPINSARELWRQQFHHAEHAHEGEPESEKARRIAGVGNEAFWITSPVTGALYVLCGQTFFRISVGGVRQEGERLLKSRALAEQVAKQLTQLQTP